MTGTVRPESGPISDVSAEFAWLHQELFKTNRDSDASGRACSVLVATSLDDSALLDRARNAQNGAKFTRLWNGDGSSSPTRSEADSALCCILAFWTRRDAERIDSLFRRSG